MHLAHHRELLFRLTRAQHWSAGLRHGDVPKNHQVVGSAYLHIMPAQAMRTIRHRHNGCGEKAELTRQRFAVQPFRKLLSIQIVF
jgi:hypothetical protein